MRQVSAQKDERASAAFVSRQQYPGYMVAGRGVSGKLEEPLSDDERIQRILRDYDKDAKLYGRLGAEVERLVKDLLRVSAIGISSVTHRLKDRDSFARKIGSPKYTSLQNVTDIVGARVITYHADDVDRVASIIRGEKNFKIDLWNTVDKRRELRTDQFGYQSLHLVASLSKWRIFDENRDLAGLKIEIQVRSLLQHTWAEIEHAYYKSTRSLPSTIRRRVSLVAGLLETADNEFVAVRNEATQLTMELPICRVEGITELIPDFSLDLPYSAIPLESDLSNKSLTLAVTTNITNRLVDESKQTEVEMYIEEGSPRSYMNKGVLVGPNVLAFPGVLPIAPPSKGEYVRIRISGLRVNACQVGLSSGLAPTVVSAVIGIGERDHLGPFTWLSSTIPVARVSQSGHFQVRELVKLSSIELPKDVGLQFTYRSFVPDAFRPPAKERSRGEMSAVQGTRLLVVLNGLPTTGRVFATISDLPDSKGQCRFHLTASDINGNGPFDPIEGGSQREIDGNKVEFAELTITGTMAFAVWECTGPLRPDGMPSFGVIVSFPAQSSICAITANGTLAPLSTVNVACSSASMPRFANRSTSFNVVEPASRIPIDVQP